MWTERTRSADVALGEGCPQRYTVTKMTERAELVCSQETVPDPEPCTFPAEGCANAKRQDLQRDLQQTGGR